MTTITIKIINKSAYVTSEEFAIMIKASNYWLTKVCAAYSKVGAHIDQDSKLPDMIFTLVDDTAEDGIAAYHTEIANQVTGPIFVKKILDLGGKLLYGGKYTVASALTHELGEALINPYCNQWVDIYGDGYQVAHEICDPVQDNMIICEIDNQKIALSDFVLPAWFNPQDLKGPYNYTKSLTQPFSLSAGGYMITRNRSGREKCIYGLAVDKESLGIKFRHLISTWYKTVKKTSKWFICN